MKLTYSLFVVALVVCTSVLQAADRKPIKALLITGGCCHDYAKQRMHTYGFSVH